MDPRLPTPVYWGDLDAHGLVILDLLRSTGIPAQAMLMDEGTLHRYAPYASPTNADGSPLPQGPSPSDAVPLRRRATPPRADHRSRMDGSTPHRAGVERIPLQTAQEEDV